MRIVMIGTGYVGLVSGACFSDFGHHVCCVDKDAGKVAALLEGRMPIFEPGLDELVARNVAAGRLEFTLDLAQALPGADAVFIAVGTPTVAVGIGGEVERIIREARPDLQVSVVSKPEFLREGAAIEDFKRPDRVVIGVNDEHAEDVLSEIYRPLLRNETPLLVMKR